MCVFRREFGSCFYTPGTHYTLPLSSLSLMHTLFSHPSERDPAENSKILTRYKERAEKKEMVRLEG